MSNVRSVGQAVREEPAVPGLDVEVRVSEAHVWRCPQTIIQGDLEEAERWDGLS